MRSSRRRCSGLSALLALSLSMLAVPVAASAASKPVAKTVSFAALFSQPQNVSLQERYQLYAPGASLIQTETVRPGTISLLMTTTSPNQRSTIEMSPAPGQSRLKVGYYPATGGVGQPNFGADAGETACDARAAVTIRDIGYDGKGFLSRLSMTFVEDCQDYLPTIFGEVQFREPHAGPVVVAPASLTFGPTFIGTSSTAPIAVINTGRAAVRMLGAAVTGPGPFTITGDHCSGTLVPAGGHCLISTVYRPTATGTAGASVTIRDSSSVSSHVVTLTGSGIGGLTDLSMTLSVNGTAIGSYQYSPQSGALMVYQASNQRLWVRAATRNVIWDLNMTSALTGSIKPGDYTNVPGFTGGIKDALSFRVAGGPGACGDSVSLLHIAQYEPALGPLSGHIGIGFIQQCTNQGNNLVIFGSVNYAR